MHPPGSTEGVGYAEMGVQHKNSQQTTYYSILQLTMYNKRHFENLAKKL